jgi:hypothetical protein
MKKIIFLSITAVLIFSSCSKEVEEEELDPKQYGDFIFFKLVTSSDTMIDYGYLFNGIPGGPSMKTESIGDSINATVIHNPSGNKGLNFERLYIGKKGSSVMGEYRSVIAGIILISMSVAPSDITFYILGETLILNIENTGTDAKYGKYAEGRFTCKVFKNFASPQIPAWGRFRIMHK